MTGRALGDPSHLFQNVDTSEIAKSRLVIFGEVHAAPAVVAVQHEVQKHMINHISASPQSAKLHVVMEHFSLEMQVREEDQQEGFMCVEHSGRVYRKLT